jgi:hypothetical protein
MGIAGCRGDDKKVGPRAHSPQVEDNHVLAPVIAQQVSQRSRLCEASLTEASFLKISFW